MFYGRDDEGLNAGEEMDVEDVAERECTEFDCLSDVMAQAETGQS